MLAADFLTAVQARVQDRVGIFLSLKTKIAKIQASPSLTMQDKATELMKRQLLLEQEMPSIMTKISNIKNGAYTISDMTAVGAFATAMERQIKDVNSLASTGTFEAGISIPWVPLLVLAGFGVGASFLVKKRRG